MNYRQMRAHTLYGRESIPMSGHERLWQNAMREKDIYYFRLFILT